MNHPYIQFVNDFVQLQDEAREMSLGTFPAAQAPRIHDNAPRVLVFAPHPDDEAIVGGLALRMRRELRHRVTAVAVSQGSRVDRKAERLEEMRGACHFLGFELVAPPPNSLAALNPKTRTENPEGWAQAVTALAEILSYHRASTIVIPHEDDFNTTHTGTHLMVLDALGTLGPRFACRVVETEFWRPMANPNLMIESSPADVADLVAATSFHRGEVRRNPYHIQLPSWMSDNVRRGSELVGGQGVAAQPFNFATLYRVRDWKAGGLVPCLQEGLLISASGDLGTIFPG